MIRKLSSTGVVFLSVLYLLLAGQVAVCSHEGSVQPQSEHDSGENDLHELFCGGDCQNISPVTLVASSPAGFFFPLAVNLAVVVGLAVRWIELPLASSRAPPQAVVP